MVWPKKKKKNPKTYPPRWKYSQNSKLSSKKSNNPIKNRPQTFIDISRKKIHRWKIIIGKDAPNHIKEIQSKIIINTIIHLLEWPASAKMTLPMLMRMWKHRNSHSLLVEMENDAAILEEFDSLLQN